MEAMTAFVRPGPVTWADLDARRKALKKRVSRAELCRRAGISESTITKGLAQGHLPTKGAREKVELILAAEQAMTDAGLQ